LQPRPFHSEVTIAYGSAYARAQSIAAQRSFARVGAARVGRVVNAR
jgi:hypothetical protein